VAEDLMQSGLHGRGTDQRWASAIPDSSTHREWLYLAVVRDLDSRRLGGGSMSRWLNRHWVVDALSMAIGSRRPERVLIHHADRGSQYTSDDFRDELEHHGIQCSLSARGNCDDNAIIESFFGLLKRERVNRVRYRTRDQARADVFDYIECFYHR